MDKYRKSLLFIQIFAIICVSSRLLLTFINNKSPSSRKFRNHQNTVPFPLSLSNVQNVSRSLKSNPKLYVVLSASVSEVVHSTPYSLMLPVSARSWLAFGFYPMIILVVHSVDTWSASDMGSALLKELNAIPNCIVYLLPSPTRYVEVSLAQIVRLFAAFLISDDDLDAYLRVSDADMIIYQGSPFRTTNVPGVHIYNGDCCLPQRPMHSIGMKVGLWRELFGSPLGLNNSRHNVSELSDCIMNWIVRKNINTEMKVSFAGVEWFTDQIIAGEVLNNINSSIPLTVSPNFNRVNVIHTPLTANVVESHEHQIQSHELWKLQERIDMSTLRNMIPFQNWSYIHWLQSLDPGLLKTYDEAHD
jgi:hypothetical protein